MKQARKTVYLDLCWKKNRIWGFFVFFVLPGRFIRAFFSAIREKYYFLIADSGPKCFVYNWRWMPESI